MNEWDFFYITNAESSEIECNNMSWDYTWIIQRFPPSQTLVCELFYFHPQPCIITKSHNTRSFQVIFQHYLFVVSDISYYELRSVKEKEIWHKMKEEELWKLRDRKAKAFFKLLSHVIFEYICFWQLYFVY